MYCHDGPCLVEVGSRCQGGEGSWLPVAHECIGYTSVSGHILLPKTSFQVIVQFLLFCGCPKGVGYIGCVYGGRGVRDSDKGLLPKAQCECCSEPRLQLVE